MPRLFKRWIALSTSKSQIKTHQISITETNNCIGLWMEIYLVDKYYSHFEQLAGQSLNKVTITISTRGFIVSFS